MRIKCFWLEPLAEQLRSLRRFTFTSSGRTCPARPYGHDAAVRIEDGVGEKCVSGYLHPHDDPRWPTKCDACDYVFQNDDEWQLSHSTLYVRKDTGEKMTLRDAPPGAMWDADWLHDIYPERLGPDGIYLIVKTPGGRDWAIDSRASNCTEQHDNEHRCWVRHGNPKSGDVTVDKNGLTCSAGGGSILTANWHGFLKNGEFIEC